MEFVKWIIMTQTVSMAGVLEEFLRTVLACDLRGDFEVLEIDMDGSEGE